MYRGYDRDAATVLALDGQASEREHIVGVFERAGFAEVLQAEPLDDQIDSFFGQVASEIHLVTMALRRAPKQALHTIEHARAKFSGPILVVARPPSVSVQDVLDAGADECINTRDVPEELIIHRAEKALIEREYTQAVEEHHRQSQKLLVNILAVLVRILDSKDPYTRNHSHNVCRYSRMLGRRYGLSEEELDRLGLAAMLHDFGKIGIVEAILNKPGRLTDDEYEIMKTHTTLGGVLLESLPDLADVVPAIIHHHEAWDGRGYPSQLKADEAHLWARIIGIADAYDVMSSRRRYKEPYPHEKCMDELQKGAGRQFDPVLASMFIEVVEAMRADGALSVPGHEEPAAEIDPAPEAADAADA